MTLYGAVIGDIVGSKYELQNIKTKDFPMVSQGCSITDDTLMTLAVAKAILKCRGKNQDGRKVSFQGALVDEMQWMGKRYPHPKGGNPTVYPEEFLSSGPNTGGNPGNLYLQ